MRTASEIALDIKLNSTDPLDRTDIIEGIRQDRAQIIEVIDELKKYETDPGMIEGLSLAQMVIQEGGHSDAH